jgi:CheY-like chemotaxis protein
MPRMTGPDLYRAVRAEGNQVRFLFTSGYDRPDVGALPSDVRAVAKPWTIAQLVAAVRSALDS